MGRCGRGSREARLSPIRARVPGVGIPRPACPCVSSSSSSSSGDTCRPCPDGAPRLSACPVSINTFPHNFCVPVVSYTATPQGCMHSYEKQLHREHSALSFDVERGVRRMHSLTRKFLSAPPARQTPSEEHFQQRPHRAGPGAATLPEKSGRTLMLSLDSRRPLPGQVWTGTAAANAVYASVHDYDYAYVVLPEAGCRLTGSKSNRARKNVWCRLIVVASALNAQYARVCMVDSDAVVHQPYTSLDVLTRMQGTAGTHFAHGVHLYSGPLAAIAQANWWWGVDSVCVANMMFLNGAIAFDLLRTWWNYDLEAIAPKMDIEGKREQTALWHVLRHNRTLELAVRTVEASTLWCPRSEGVAIEEYRTRPRCKNRVGCGADFFFCHLPHYPHVQTVALEQSNLALILPTHSHFTMCRVPAPLTAL
eukprot:7380826-Prymnesium_polylepis.1